MMEQSRDRPITIAMLALGGQGGGVLTGWLVETAEANGYMAQSTYVAGVAQRTGATVYCVEMFPRDKVEAAGQPPVFTPYPVPGDVDLVIAGEMAETGRAIEKGFVTPNITTLIASSHRVYSMPEKEALGDGIIDLSKVAEVAAKASKQFVCFDMQSTADNTGSIISSVLLGAVAASGALPFAREAFEETIRQMGKAVDANLRGFAAGYEGGTAGHAQAVIKQTAVAEPRGSNGETLAARIDAEFPEPVRNTALHGALRTLDYQDANYASTYLDRLADIRDLDDARRGHTLTAEVARQLALQMCYEDTIRVADLKIRRERLQRVREHVGAAADQPVKVIEYFHPRLEEICDMLPASLGSFILRSKGMQKLLGPFLRSGRNIKTTGISGLVLLRSIAAFQRFRRGTYRFGKQEAFIGEWLNRITSAAGKDYDYALSIARCIEIVKGYGETYERGMNRYLATIAAAQDAGAVKQLRRAALADEKGIVFTETLAALEAGR